MKVKRTLIVFTVLVFSGLVFAQGKGAGNAAVSELPSKEKRWALIVGIDNYEKDVSSLRGAVNDAKALKNVLVNYAGFPEDQVILLTSDTTAPNRLPSRANILEALNNLSSRVPEDGLLLFSFSGHGVSVENQAFLIPSDGKITKNLPLLEDFSIEVWRIKRAIQGIRKVKQVLMLLDACRNEPGKGDTPNVLTEAYKAGFSFDTANSNVKAFAALYATSVGERAFEFYDPETSEFRGYFSYAVEEALKGKAANEKGEVTLSRLVDYLEKTVPERVRSQKGEIQEPTVSLSETYKANELVIAIADKPTVRNARNDEVTFWQTIENSGDQRDFTNYLSRASSGEFKGIYRTTAELKLFRLKKSASAAAWTGLKGTARKLIKYDLVRAFSEGVAKVEIGTTGRPKYGIVNRNGVELTPVKYDYLGEFKNGLARVKVGDVSTEKFGFIDKTGREVIPLKYKDLEDFSDDLALFNMGDWSSGKFGFVDRTGTEMIPPKYDYAKSFSEGIAVVKTDHPTGQLKLINKNETEIPSAKYQDILPFSEGMAVVTNKIDQTEKYGFIDKTGKEVISPRYDSASSFSEGMAAVRIGDWSNGRYGFIDKLGREIIPFKYNATASFRDGFAIVGTGPFDARKFGFVDKTGREVVSPIYEQILQLPRGEFLVQLGQGDTARYGVIDKTGKEIIPVKWWKIVPKFNFLEEYSSRSLPTLGNTIAIGTNISNYEKFGLIDRSGKELAAFKYDLVAPVPLPGFDDFFVTAEGKYATPQVSLFGLIDRTGKEIFKPQFRESDIWCLAFAAEGYIGVKMNGRKGFIDFYGNEYFDL